MAGRLLPTFFLPIPRALRATVALLRSAAVFSSLGNLQTGMFVPAAASGVDQPFTFDVDRVTIVPNPPVAALLARSGLLLAQAPPPATARAKSHGPTANRPP